MAAVPSELSLDCKLHHSFSMLLMKSFPDHHTDQTHHNRKLEEFVSRLQEERLKIDAFKRELPLCMQLLTNAMEESRQKLEALRGNEDKKSAVLEDFIPLRNSNSESSEKASSTCDKANWMISAQLWSQANEETKPQYSTIASPNHKGQSVHDQIAGLTFNVSPNKLHKNISGGAFLPFSNERISSNQCPSSTPLQALPELALTTSPDGKQIMEDEKLYSQTENSSKGGRSSNNGGVVSDQRKRIITVLCEVKTTSKTASTTSTTQSHRKARRCWSPDLHRRFVNALQMLGGSQVATPKQIRELMKVDGLTNDEVKSHLQKYRLHTRRPGQQSQAGGAVTPQLVVLGGIWVPPPTGTTNALFSSHPLPHEPPQPYFPSAAPPHDSYTITTLQSHNHTFHHHYHHHNLNGYKTTSQSLRSPKSESIEDGKSESESGENQGEDNRGGGYISLKL